MVMAVKLNGTLFLLMIILFAYIIVLKSNGGSTDTRQKVFIDSDGNEVPIFNKDTFFPSPDGGRCLMTPIIDKEEYFNAVETPTVQCTQLEDFKGYKGCMDGFKKRDNCVVLSFGISWHFEFEDSVIDKLGCQAYSFDPTMGTADFERKNGKDKFFNLGLSSFKGSKTIRYMNRKVLSKVDRYVNIVQMLSLENTEIDFLKVDIEGSEIDFFLDTATNNPELLKKVRQIQMEFHNMEMDPKFHSGNRRDTTQFDSMKIIDILHCHGFELAHSEPNMLNPKHQFIYNGKKRVACYVTTWIRK